MNPIPVTHLACKGETVVDGVHRGADDEGVAAIVDKDGIDLIHYGKVQRASENLCLTPNSLISSTQVAGFTSDS